MKEIGRIPIEEYCEHGNFDPENCPACKDKKIESLQKSISKRIPHEDNCRLYKVWNATYKDCDCVKSKVAKLESINAELLEALQAIVIDIPSLVIVEGGSHELAYMVQEAITNATS